MRLADLVDEQSFDAVDLELSEFFRSRVDEISNSLYSQYPHRQHILKAAFGAHDRGDYAVSVPLFLIQADGICYEMLGVQLYKKRRGIPATADAIDIQALDPFTAAVLEPLRILLPLAEDTVKIQNLDIAFNRHAIVHGLATQYGTEINSLKSISLLDYLLFVYRRAIEDDDLLDGP